MVFLLLWQDAPGEKWLSSARNSLSRLDTIERDRRDMLRFLYFKYLRCWFTTNLESLMRAMSAESQYSEQLEVSNSNFNNSLLYSKLTFYLRYSKEFFQVFNCKKVFFFIPLFTYFIFYIIINMIWPVSKQVNVM